MNGAANIDRSTYLWLNRLQQRPSIISVFRAISHSGDGYLYVALGISLFYLQAMQSTMFVKTALIAFLIEIPCFILLKASIKRDRPFVQMEECSIAITPSDKFSMPSGHTAAAFLMAFLISYFYYEFSVVVYLWATCIGLSRVVLGVHYPSDIVAGAALGMSCSYLSLALFL